MIRILHILGGLNRGGIESFLMNCYRKLDRTHIQFDFLVHSNSKDGFYDEIVNLGGRIYYIPPRSKGINQNRKMLSQFFHNHCNQYEIVHQHMSSLSYLLPLRMAQIYKIKIRIAHSHSTSTGKKLQHVILHSLNRLRIQSIATNYWACSDLAGIWLFGKELYNSGSVQIINNGIEIEKYRFNSEIRNIYRKEMKVENRIVIGHVGRFSYPKNHLMILDVFYEYTKKVDNSVLALIGEGELIDKIRMRVQEIGLEQKVLFLGVRSDISSLLNAIDLFIFPSFYEGLPLSVVEAQISGLPCVISDTISKNVILSPKTVSLSISSSVDSWVAKITEMLSIQGERTIPENISKFDINEVVKKLSEFYSNPN